MATAKTAVAPMKAVQVPKPGADFWASGTTADEDDTLRFAELSGVRPMIETYPLEKAAEGYARMLSGKAQFRVVLTM